MNLDKETQYRILLTLRSIYPHSTADVVKKETRQKDLENIWYLKQKGLVNAAMFMAIDGKFAFQHASITEAGIDYFESFTTRADHNKTKVITNSKSDSESNRNKPILVAIANKESNIVGLVYAIAAGIIIAIIMWGLNQNGYLV